MKLLDFFRAERNCVGENTLCDQIVGSGYCWVRETYPEETAFALEQGWITIGEDCINTTETGDDFRDQLECDF